MIPLWQIAKIWLKTDQKFEISYQLEEVQGHTTLVVKLAHPYHLNEGENLHHTCLNKTIQNKHNHPSYYLI